MNRRLAPYRFWPSGENLNCFVLSNFVSSLLVSARFKMSFAQPLIRHFGTSASCNGQLVKTPIALFGLEGRYATALYSAATKEKKLDAVEKEIKNLQGIIKKDVKFRDFMQDPSIKKSTKISSLGEISKKLKLTPVTTNFLSAIAENGRLSKFDSIASAFSTLMSAHRGEIICEVTTAKALSPEQLKELETALKLFLKKGETLLLNSKVDPSIVGGMVVSIGDKYVDMSIGSKIKKYTEIMSAVA